ncbi:glutathione S-transferase domain-containing protein [Thozetella sp. PMI_491]|nr:glutathione S-transferase domain-containing protein [Thozetella sp. PMI_491]
MAAPQIKLYTIDACPATHRVLIVMKELGLSYELEKIDITKPRTAEFLAINPRGKVPAVTYNGQHIAESAIIAQFFADAYPSGLIPAPTGPDAAFKRAKIAWFFDTFMTTVYTGYHDLILANSLEKAEESAKAILAAVIKDMEPLLSDAKPFFGGSESLTMAEALTMPFFLRIYRFSEANIFPKWLAGEMEAKAPNFHAWAKRALAHPSVADTYYDEVNIAINTAHVKFMTGKEI